MSNIKKVLCTMALILPTFTALAQTNGSNSPYSRYGFGLLGDGAQGFNKGMGGVAYGFSSNRDLNFKNPASYSAIDSLSLVFDIGLTLQNANIGTSRHKTNARNTSLDHVNVGFRAAKNLGVSLGLRPFSTIGYSISQDESNSLNSGEITQTDVYKGDGGLHEVYIGAGWRPFKPIAIGVNVGYLWGEMTHNVTASFSDATIYSRRREYAANISTYKLGFGLQYYQPISKKLSLTIGAAYQLGHEIDNAAKYYDQKLSSSAVITADTQFVKKAFQLPHTFGAGVMVNYKNKLKVGLDYTFQKWKDVKYPELNATTGLYESVKGAFSNSHKMALGAEFIPNPESMHWGSHVRYRAGVSYTTPYLRINNGDGPASYAASIGVALPLIKTHGTYRATTYQNCNLLNFSAQFERVQPKHSWQIAENYIRFTIGITFNERWFQKWKVE